MQNHDSEDMDDPRFADASEDEEDHKGNLHINVAFIIILCIFSPLCGDCVILPPPFVANEALACVSHMISCCVWLTV